MVGHLLLGLVLGAASSVPPGPCNLAVVDALARSRRRAVATGLGAALGDAIYAALGVIGLGRIITAERWIPPTLQLLGGVAIVAAGVSRLRPGRAAASPGRGGFARGLALDLGNPATFVTWVLLVGAFLSGASAGGAALAVAGIGLGSFGWYLALAHTRLSPHRLIAPLGALAVCGGGLTIVRAVAALVTA